MDEVFLKERYANTHNIYQPSVLIDNWREDLYREEEKLQKLIQESQHGNLHMQRTSNYLKDVLRPVKLTTNLDGFLHDGDVIMLKCCSMSETKPLYLAARPLLPPPNECDASSFRCPCPVSATKNSACRARTAFAVYRADSRIPNTVPIMYGEAICFFTTAVANNLKLHSEAKTFLKYAKKSKNQEVEFVDEASSRVMWKILYRNPEYRMEMEGNWVPVNADVVIKHVFSNQNLALENDCTIGTIFGREYEISVRNYLDVHKSETSQNIWQFFTPPVAENLLDTAINLPGQQNINPENYHSIITAEGPKFNKYN